MSLALNIVIIMHQYVIITYTKMYTGCDQVSGTTVRISKHSARILKMIARQKGESLQKVLDEAVEEHRRTLILKEANSAYARLRDDSALWGEEQQERDAWSITLTDGQEDSY